MRRRDPTACRTEAAGESGAAVAHLFVYGTLRRGGPMHALLDPGAVRCGDARMRGRLYDLGAFPGFADGRRGEKVRGELYRIHDPGLLDALDRYEGRAYRRVVREARPADGGDPVAAWVYLYAGSLRGRRRIASGDYLASQRSDVTRAARADRPA
jgi:gamma-glutamylcyclotransferase (GGCT)/AIG2-like uncharacterized protein YtfP